MITRLALVIKHLKQASKWGEEFSGIVRALFRYWDNVNHHRLGFDPCVSSVKLSYGKEEVEETAGDADVGSRRMEFEGGDLIILGSEDLLLGSRHRSTCYQ